jgi:hypothetical protein
VKEAQSGCPGTSQTVEKLRDPPFGSVCVMFLSAANKRPSGIRRTTRIDTRPLYVPCLSSSPRRRSLPTMAVDRAAERKRLTDLHEKATDAFDRAVMTLSGGALAISITFIHDVAHHPRHKVYLGIAWLSFVASLLLILWSFLTSERAIVRMVAQVDAEAEEVPRGKITDWLNWGSAGAFLVGVVFVVLFAWKNL